MDWSRGIYVSTTGAEVFQLIDNTRSALKLLMNAWPVSDGRQFVNAMVLCQSVLDGQLDPDRARDAFIEAAWEANVVVRERAKSHP
ncbi:DUF982 domain-containing protein [Rhizobium tubonense]